MTNPLQRNIILAICGAALIAGPGFSQTSTPPNPPSQTDAPPPPPPPYGEAHRDGPEHRLERLQQALNLTPDQTVQVKALFKAERSKMEAVHSNTALQDEERHAQMMAIHQDAQNKMHALLSPDQAARYDAIEARMREHGPGAPPMPPSPPPPPPPSGPGAS